MQGKIKNLTLLMIIAVFLGSFLGTFLGTLVLFSETTYSRPTETTCNSCEDCSAKLNGSYDIVTLENDIINHAGTCIIFGANDVTFDGGGHLIDSDNSYGYAIFMDGKSGNTVKNCIIEDYTQANSAGILLWNSNNNILENNVIRYNIKGIILDTSLNNVIKKSTVNNNFGKGFELISSNQNEIYYNNIISNGVHATDTGSNTWYGDYPGGGNYWSGNNPCIDIFGGPYQNMPWSDWICDSHYIYDNGNIYDAYPWFEEDLINKMPTLSPIPDIVAGINGTVMIVLNARDPTDDPLTYHINDSRFEQDGNVFIWQPGEGNQGNYTFIVWVTDIDGYTATQMVNVEVIDAFTIHHFVPHFSTETYSSAATAQMIIAYLGNDSLSQQEIYDYGIIYNLPENPSGELDPMGMDAALGHFDPYDLLLDEPHNEADNNPGGNPYQGYNFGARSVPSDSIENYMRDIAHWMDYRVHLYAGSEEYADPDRVPPAVPIYGDTNGYNNWVVVNGFASDGDPVPEGGGYNPNFNIYGFWLTDPNTEGLGINRYVTAEEAESTYFKPISSTDQYNGKFVQVAEPPPMESDAIVSIITIEKTRENVKLVTYMRNTLGISEKEKPLDPIMKSSSMEERSETPQVNWREIIPGYLLDDPLFSEAFEGSVEGKQAYIIRSDGNYYIITFEKQIGRETLTTAAIIVDADSGIFKEAAWVSDPEDYIWISKDDAINNVLRYLRSNKIRISGLDRQKITAEFTWEPGQITSSPFQPYWRVIVKDMIFYVKNDGTVIPSLQINF